MTRKGTVDYVVRVVLAVDLYGDGEGRRAIVALIRDALKRRGYTNIEVRHRQDQGVIIVAPHLGGDSSTVPVGAFTAGANIAELVSSSIEFELARRGLSAANRDVLSDAIRHCTITVRPQRRDS